MIRMPKAAEAIFASAILASIIFIYIAAFKPRSFLINESINDYPLIPLYVIVFSVIGGLMYFFASTAGEWKVKKEKIKDDQNKLDEFNDTPFLDKLKDFDIERKGLRVVAAPLMAIGIYLLFDLIFFDFNITTEQPNISLTNSTLQDVINAIETTNDTEKMIQIKAGISFLVGAFVKQFLDLIQALAEGIGMKK
ncbi:hypothetical protein LI82_09745 [Methanococcoides methylutens]|uniref:Uncharacterized protein n=2 Tax=Methanococcoides methylutens TaxID=2226 RepID=A0A099SYM9_METMT|nr:hypothetical protein LI82_09745 [Methanococcoides methylutens]